MNILICNVGSTSLKYQLFDMDRGEKVLCAGGAERVGAAKSLFYHTDNQTGTSIRMDAVFPTHITKGCSAACSKLACDFKLQGRKAAP